MKLNILDPIVTDTLFAVPYDDDDVRRNWSASHADIVPVVVTNHQPFIAYDPLVTDIETGRSIPDKVTTEDNTIVLSSLFA